MLRRASAALIAALFIVACGSEDDGSNGHTETLTGVVVAIEARSIEDIESFTLVHQGRKHEVIVTDDTEFAFAPGHLNEHRTTADPVEVMVERRDGVLYALTVQDADH